MDTPHPTREEWEARQAAGPPGLRAILAAAAERRAVAADARRAERDRLDKLASEHRAAFEAAVRGALEVAGCGWLAAYRAPERANEFGRFAHNQTIWFAVFEPEAVGLSTIQMCLLSNGPGRAWELHPEPFTVSRPTGCIEVATLADAIEAAAEYPRTPF
jgi:hypothetical protein